MPSNTFFADEVTGKVLSARAGVNVPVKSIPFDDQPTLYTVQGGNAIGVVYSWVNPVAGRKNLWWQIEKEGGGYVWVEHLPGRFDVKKLEQQGLVTEEDKAWDDKTLMEKITTIGAYVLGGWAVIKIAQLNVDKEANRDENW